jgi:type II secretory pathway component PulK
MKEQPRGNKGFALMVVILVLLLVSFLASQLVLQVRTELRIAANYRQRTAGRLLAEGGVNLAIFRLVGKPDIEYEELLDGLKFFEGRSYETVLPSGKMKYYAVNESGKINLNSTSYGLFKKFLEYQGLESDEVAIIIDSLQDWRDKGDLYRLNGAEQDYYQGLDRPYIPRDGRIEDPGEFFLIRGTDVLRGKIDPYEVFTANNKKNQVNFNSLSPAMLDFLVGGDEEKARQYHEEYELARGRLSKAKMKEIIGAESFAAMGTFLVDRVSRNKFYTITVEGYAGDFTVGSEVDIGEEEDSRHPGMRVRVLIEQTKQGFRYLSWKEQRI